MPPPPAKLAALAPLALFASPAAAQQTEQRSGLWGLFWQSFDIFSVVLILGSILAVALIVRGVLDIRRSVMLPERSVARLNELAKAGRVSEMVEFAKRDRSIPSRILAAAADSPSGTPVAMREQAEVVAGEQCAKWYRRVEPLNLVGNLGPLVGLAGTVWGMILAFQGLGAAGGQANPGVLSLGISKALFHTLLGLLLAVPSLAAYGVLRARVDRLCNEAMVLSGRLVEILIHHRNDLAEPANAPSKPTPARTTEKRPSDAA